MYLSNQNHIPIMSQRSQDSHQMMQNSVTSAVSSSRETESHQEMSLTAFDNPQFNMENSMMNTKQMDSLCAADQYSHRQDVQFVKKKNKKLSSNERLKRNHLRQGQSNFLVQTYNDSAVTMNR